MTCGKLLDLYLILLKHANNLEQCKDGHGACIHITASYFKTLVCKPIMQSVSLTDHMLFKSPC